MIPLDDALWSAVKCVRWAHELIAAARQQLVFFFCMFCNDAIVIVSVICPSPKITKEKETKKSAPPSASENCTPTESQDMSKRREEKSSEKERRKKSKNNIVQFFQMWEASLIALKSADTRLHIFALLGYALILTRILFFAASVCRISVHSMSSRELQRNFRRFRHFLTSRWKFRRWAKKKTSPRTPNFVLTLCKYIFLH